VYVGYIKPQFILIKSQLNRTKPLFPFILMTDPLLKSMNIQYDSGERKKDLNHWKVPTWELSNPSQRTNPRFWQRWISRQETNRNHGHYTLLPPFFGGFPAIFSSRTAVEFLCCGDLPKTGNSVIVILMTAWWFQPLWKIWKSIGMIIPNIWKNNSHVPNHQPVICSNVRCCML